MRLGAVVIAVRPVSMMVLIAVVAVAVLLAKVLVAAAVAVVVHVVPIVAIGIVVAVVVLVFVMFWRVMQMMAVVGVVGPMVVAPWSAGDIGDNDTPQIAEMIVMVMILVGLRSACAGDCKRNTQNDVLSHASLPIRSFPYPHCARWKLNPC